MSEQLEDYSAWCTVVCGVSDSPKRDRPSFAPLPILYDEGWDSFWNICRALQGVVVDRHTYGDKYNVWCVYSVVCSVCVVYVCACVGCVCLRACECLLTQ